MRAHSARQRRKRVALVVLVISAAGLTGAEAQEVSTEDPQVAEPTEAKIEIHGFVDLYYAWNQNAPASGENFYPGVGNSAKRADQFALNLAALEISRVPTPLGFHLIAAAGNEMDVLHSGEPHESDLTSHIYQASASYATGWGRGVVFEAGIYPGHIGFESPLPRDNWSYTQSLAGQFTPSYNAGVKSVIPIAEHWSVEAHVGNGWQTIGDVNRAKSFGTKVAWDTKPVSIALNTWWGAELPDDERHVRRLLDLVAVVRPFTAWSFAGEGYVGRQERPGGGDDGWSNLALWVRFARSERPWSISARSERLSDQQGAISSIAQTWTETTLTLEVRPHGDLLALRLEGRRDRSDAAIFDDHGEPTRVQTLVVLAAIASF